MVEIETFLRGVDGAFVRVEVCRTSPPDHHYIEGAIRLSVGGVEIIGTPEWDYVDQLWCYIATMAATLRTSGYAETFFPDQPIRLSFREAGPRVLVTADFGGDIRRASTSSAELLGALRAAGTVFFRKMSELCPHSYAEAERELSA
ncbi:hypothetical protein [Marinitenerispora sediminis]|uniref:YbjN domain-containing protein n=1 Tax=Marinitenerispora sediminis TaxID=1931232 RepID=A0A368SY42_9ACTN|nr:hypothetical protein [Marinitenerispora sediminis]RCV48442.1 hypothetical protein DEF24_26300 [Marinitenerispora sediminis]RCV48584.1 hypothetical protein DEF28_23085 [Marinitenerispora sediminis]RCV49620.1 hypothetical protein DEF23_23365 [Marinitenerispora sediminis]